MKVFIIGGLVSSNDLEAPSKITSFQRSCQEIGSILSATGHEIILCSPFDDSADVHVVRGIAAANKEKAARVSFHFIDNEEVANELNKVIEKFNLSNVSRIPHPPPMERTQESLRYAWLLCQLSAMESSHITIALGGELDGAANMLLLLADGKRRTVLPLPFLGGAAKLAFERRRYELTDRLGDEIDTLYNSNCTSRTAELLAALTKEGVERASLKQGSPNFFISYARDRQAEADFVETLLRRRNLKVFRDETDFGAGYAIPNSIKEAIFEANVFIALWSSEYACSPWCFDEMEIALDRHEKNAIKIWILRIDATRIVPKRARDLLYFDAVDRSRLAACITNLISQFE